MKRPKQRPPDTKDIKSKHIMTTVKTSLKSILGYNSNDINDLSYKQKDDRIQDAVYRVNNGCLNIRMLAMEALLGRERPLAFRRGETTKNSCELNGSL